MDTEHRPAADREPTEKWRHLPERVRFDDMVESVALTPPPESQAAAGDPETAWMLRHG